MGYGVEDSATPRRPNVDELLSVKLKPTIVKNKKLFNPNEIHRVVLKKVVKPISNSSTTEVNHPVLKELLNNVNRIE